VTEESQVCRFFPFVSLRVRMTGQVVFQNKGRRNVGKWNTGLPSPFPSPLWGEGKGEGTKFHHSVCHFI